LINVPSRLIVNATQTTAIARSIGHSSSAYSLLVVSPSGSDATVSEIAEEPIDSPNDAIYPVALSVDNPQGLVLVGEKVRARTASPEAGTR